jgi:hypothetical protein
MTPRDDDELARRVARAYDDVLHEPVPQRLKDLLAAPSPVVDLSKERARRRGSSSQWTWAHWGGMAASLAIGVVAGVLFMSRTNGEALLVERAGQVVAGAPLAHALDARLASERDARVAVQLSFVDRDGRYCRTFTAPSVAGLACRDGANWSVVATAQPTPAASGEMRQAASSLPKPVLDAVDARIAGNALNAAQERAARDTGWRNRGN